jgi:hypothetical protein
VLRTGDDPHKLWNPGDLHPSLHHKVLLFSNFEEKKEPGFIRLAGDSVINRLGI